MLIVKRTKNNYDFIQYQENKKDIMQYFEEHKQWQSEAIQSLAIKYVACTSKISQTKDEYELQKLMQQQQQNNNGFPMIEALLKNMLMTIYDELQSIAMAPLCKLVTFNEFFSNLRPCFFKKNGYKLVKMIPDYDCPTEILFFFRRKFKLPEIFKVIQTAGFQNVHDWGVTYKSWWKLSNVLFYINV